MRHSRLFTRIVLLLLSSGCQTVSYGHQPHRIEPYRLKHEPRAAAPFERLPPCPSSTAIFLVGCGTGAHQERARADALKALSRVRVQVATSPAPSLTEQPSTSRDPGCSSAQKEPV